MTGAQIKEFRSGKPVYLELNTAGSVVGVPGSKPCSFSTPMPPHEIRARRVCGTGRKVTKDNIACIDWKETPNNPCTKYDKTGDTVTFINVANGQPRGKVTKKADRNVEKLGL